MPNVCKADAIFSEVSLYTSLSYCTDVVVAAFTQP